MSKFKTVLFDLDGTLLDTSRGIFNSVRFAEKKLGLEPLGDDKLTGFIGPPPIQSYMKFHGLTEEEAVLATKYHRQYGAEQGIYEAEVYKGIPKLLDELKSRDIKLGVCTLKRQDIAENVLKNFNLFGYFDVVVGIDNGEKLTKSDTIHIAVNRLNSLISETALIGDSGYDAEGAELSGVSFIVVLYGFGFSDKTSYPFLCAETVKELSDILLY